MTEGPYKLPKGWRWVRLGEVAYRESKTIKPAEEPSKIFRYLGMEHLDAGQWEEPIYVELEGAMIKSQAIIFYPGMVLYGKLRPYLNKVVIPTVEGVASTEFVPLLTNNNFLIPEYLGAYLRSPFFVSYASRNTSGSRQPRVQFGAFWDALIPLPPISEQKRIVERINDLFSRIREAKRLRQEAQQEAERLWQSVLADTFPKPGTKLPNGWQWVKLGEVFEFQQGAAMSPKRRQRRNPKPFLRTRNILWGYVDVNTVDEMDFTDEEVEKLRLQPGDLLVCEGGDVGKTAIWEGSLRIMLYQNHIHRLRARDSSVEPRFVMYWMQAAYKVFIAYQGAESRTAIPNLSGRRLKEFLIPLCILSEQKKIVTYLEAVQEKIKTLRQSQSQVNSEIQFLENTILEKAFRGDL